MGKGLTAVKYFGSAGHVLMSDVPNWEFLYQSSIVKHAEYNAGDRVVLPDGRAFRYGRSSNIVPTTSFGLKFWSKMGDNGVDYVTGADIDAEDTGSETLHITAADITLDELRGGYVIVHTHTTDHNDQFRGIIGNTATDADGDITIYLDAPLERAILTTYGVEVHANPYSNLASRAAVSRGGVGGDHYSSVAGVPMVITAAANQYLWLQTWGPCWLNPQGSWAVATGRRALWFDYEGGVHFVNTNVATKSLQLAGFVMDRGDGADRAKPLVYLQISP